MQVALLTIHSIDGSFTFGSFLVNLRSTTACIKITSPRTTRGYVLSGSDAQLPNGNVYVAEPFSPTYQLEELKRKMLLQKRTFCNELRPKINQIMHKPDAAAPDSVELICSLYTTGHIVVNRRREILSGEDATINFSVATVTNDRMKFVIHPLAEFSKAIRETNISVTFKCGMIDVGGTRELREQFRKKIAIPKVSEREVQKEKDSHCQVHACCCNTSNKTTRTALKCHQVTSRDQMNALFAEKGRTDQLSLEPVEKQVEAVWNENKPAIDAFLKTLAQCIKDLHLLESMPAFCHALCNLVQCVFNTPEPWTEASDSRTIGRQTGHHTLAEI
ncbi:unnamed protein product [Dicrocoelium dendriticum]|nr:unnamed protein product [Dicrocoelium dendriticum]